MIANYSDDARKVGKAIKAVKAAGVKVPEAVTEAETRLALVVNRPTLTEAEGRIRAADTQEALDAAVVELAQAVSLVQAADSPAFAQTLQRVRGAELAQAIARELPAILADLAGRYSVAAGPFTDAVNRIPDITGVSPLDFSEETTKALVDARKAVEPLNTLYAAYDALAQMAGADMIRYNKDKDLRRLANRIGEYTDDDQRDQAANLLGRYHFKDSSLALGRLAPHVAVVRVGGTLRLADDLL